MTEATLETGSETKPSTETEQTEVPSFIQGIPIDLLEESVRITLGPSFYKFVSYVDFISSLRSLIDKDTNSSKLQEYILAPNTFHLSVGLDRIEMSMFYPECVRDLIYGSAQRKSVIPNIIISHALKLQSGTDWRVVDTKYWSTNKTLPEIVRKSYLSASGKPAYLSIMPFTNVYTDGNLCFGSNVRILNIKGGDFKPLHWYYEMLFTSPFNNDLGISALKSSSPYRSDIAAWYKHLADLATKKEPFPYEQLSAFSN